MIEIIDSKDRAPSYKRTWVNFQGLDPHRFYVNYYCCGHFCEHGAHSDQCCECRGLGREACCRICVLGP